MIIDRYCSVLQARFCIFCRCYHSSWFVLFAGKQEIIPFMAANPGVTCDSWTTIRTKVMNEQMAVKNKLKRYC